MLQGYSIVRWASKDTYDNGAVITQQLERKSHAFFPQQISFQQILRIRNWTTRSLQRLCVIGIKIYFSEILFSKTKWKKRCVHLMIFTIESFFWMNLLRYVYIIYIILQAAIFMENFEYWRALINIQWLGNGIPTTLSLSRRVFA